jgi:hypothetical protein
MLFIFIICFTGCTVSQRPARTIIYPKGGVCKVSKIYLLNSIEFVSFKIFCAKVNQLNQVI